MKGWHGTSRAATFHIRDLPHGPSTTQCCCIIKVSVTNNQDPWTKGSREYLAHRDMAGSDRTEGQRINSRHMRLSSFLRHSWLTRRADLYVFCSQGYTWPALRGIKAITKDDLSTCCHDKLRISSLPHNSAHLSIKTETFLVLRTVASSFLNQFETHICKTLWDDLRTRREVSIRSLCRPDGLLEDFVVLDWKLWSGLVSADRTVPRDSAHLWSMRAPQVPPPTPHSMELHLALGLIQPRAPESSILCQQFR